MCRPNLSSLLSANGGYVDTAGYLALHGLFTAHVTGNFVTVGAALAFGTSGIIDKLAALPVFCAVVAVVRATGFLLARDGNHEVPAFLSVAAAVLGLGFVLAVALGPFADGDSWQAILTGMILVAAMAVQNAVHRIHLANIPPTTLMTGNTTQIIIDLVDLIRSGPAEQKAQMRGRIARLGVSVLSFALGCAAAAIFFYVAGNWCFVVAPVLGLLAAQRAARAPTSR